MARVLVVGHNPTMERLLTVILKKRGHEVVTAGDGETGLRKCFDRHSPDLIIMEMYLPDMYSPDFIGQVKRNASIPVLVMGDNLNDGPVAMEVGADEFLRKPITYGVLVDAVSRNLPENIGARA